MLILFLWWLLVFIRLLFGIEDFLLGPLTLRVVVNEHAEDVATLDVATHLTQSLAGSKTRLSYLCYKILHVVAVIPSVHGVLTEGVRICWTWSTTTTAATITTISIATN